MSGQFAKRAKYSRVIKARHACPICFQTTEFIDYRGGGPRILGECPNGHRHPKKQLIYEQGRIEHE